MDDALLLLSNLFVPWIGLQAVLELRIEILAAVGEDDGITRWLD